MKRADDYFKASEYDKAKIEYLNLLRLDPQNTTAFQRMGLIWLEQGVPLRAVPFLLKARELAPNDLGNRIKLARAFMGVGETARARKEAVEILQQSPANDEATLVLAGTNRNQKDIEYTEQQLQNFRGRETATVYLASADLSLQKKDLISAENALQKALALDPKSPLPHSAMGMLHMLQKRPEQAGVEFKTAAELASVRSDIRLRYAEFLMQSGAVDEAKTSLKQITDKAPDYLPAWRLGAQLALRQKNYDESLSLLENILLRDSANIEAKLLRTQVLLAKGDAKKAREGLEALDKSYPNVPVIKYQLALTEVQNNNLSQAIDSLNQALAVNPDYTEALLLLGQLNLRSGNAQAVVQAMTELLKKHPIFPPAQLLLADSYRFLGRLDDAANVISDQIKAFPQNSQSYFFLGVIRREQGKLDEARKAFEKAQELSPKNFAAVNQLVELDIASKDFESATRRVQEQSKESPRSPEVFFMEARIFVAQRDWERAESTLQKALELNPNFSAAYDLLISAYLYANRLPEAAKQLEGLLAKNPDNIPALMTSAMIYEKLSDFPKARDAYEKLLLKNSDFAPALNNLAYLYAERLNQLDKAYALARKARQIQPEDPAVADTLGWIAYKQGDYQQAITLLKESADKLPAEPEIQFHLGMANYMMAQTDAAKAAFQRAVTASKVSPVKEESRRRLALLGEAAGDSKEVSIEEIQAWTKQHPKDLLAWIRLAELYEGKGMPAEGAKAYEEVLKLNPKLPSPTIKLAQLYAGPLKDSQRALPFAKKARELAPSDPKTANLLGKIAYQIGNLPWAYSLLQESARQSPDDAELLFNYGWAAYGLGKVNEAQQAMKTILSLSSALADQFKDGAKSFLAMTTAEGTSAAVAAAEKEAQRLLSADPGYVPAQMIDAANKALRGEKSAAMAVYVQVLKRYPEFGPAQKHLAALYVDEPGALDQAYELAMKARKTFPDDPELEKVLAILAYKKNEFSYAIQLLEARSRKTPLDAKSLYYLGMSRLQLKQTSQGRENLNQSLEAGLQEPLSSQARQALAQLP